jgi:polyribonucleotide nucleotidyltransferase
MCLSASYCHNKNNSSFLKMMLILNVLLIFSSFSTIQSYIFSPKTSTSLLSRTIRSKVEVGINNKPSSQKWRSNVLLKMMSDSEASSSEIEIVAEDTSSQSTSSQPSDPNDFSQYAVGNQYPATLVSSKSFGLFAKISTGKDVLLPRALMSRSQFDKFTKMLEDKAKKEIKVELVSVSAENSTLSARLVQSLNLDDLSEDRVFNATVSSIHDFGLFATVEEIGAEGLVPISKLNVNAADIKSLYRYLCLCLF